MGKRGALKANQKRRMQSQLEKGTQKREHGHSLLKKKAESAK